MAVAACGLPWPVRALSRLRIKARGTRAYPSSIVDLAGSPGPDPTPRAEETAKGGGGGETPKLNPRVVTREATAVFPHPSASSHCSYPASPKHPFACLPPMSEPSHLHRPPALKSPRRGPLSPPPRLLSPCASPRKQARGAHRLTPPPPALLPPPHPRPFRVRTGTRRSPTTRTLPQVTRRRDRIRCRCSALVDPHSRSGPHARSRKRSHR